MARAPKQPAAKPPPAVSPVELPEIADGRRPHPVLSPLKHDGRRYGPDTPDADTVMMTDGEAETLIALGILAEPA